MARLYTDYLAIGGMDNFRIFDTDFPDGSITRFYPDNSKIIDLASTPGQIQLFDSMIAEPDRNYIIDLQADLLRKFFKIFSDIEFDTEIAKLDSRVVVFFIVDKSKSSLSAAVKVGACLRDSDFFIVDNSAMGSALVTLSPNTQKQLLNADRKVVLPRFSDDLVRLLEDPRFSLFEFMAGRLKGIPNEISLELWNVLDMLYEQRSPDSRGVIHLM